MSALRARFADPLRRWTGVSVVCALGLLLALPPALAAAGCRPGEVEFRTPKGDVVFHVSLARTEAEREHGLMGRRHMARDAGMLFLFGKPGSVAFWMHDTLIPLDMIFLDQSGRVTRVHAMAKPMSDMPINGGDAVFAVLEVNGGVAAEAGIVPGTLMRADAMPQKLAAWRCAAR